MDENSEQAIPQPAEEASSVSDIGALLSEARERLGLSIEEAALQLRLGSRQLQALEKNDYASLPGVAFVRGFLRNYARLLGLDPEPLLLALRSYSQNSAQQSISLHSEKIALVQRGRKFWLPYVIASIAIGLTLGGWMAYMDYRESQVLHRVVETAVPVVEKPSTLELVKPNPPQALPPATEQMTPPTTPPATTSGTPVPAAVEPAATTATGRLEFLFSQRAWVGITDRDGNEIFNKTKAAGTEDAAEGLPPFNIAVGNAAGVHMTFNGKPVDLAPYTKGNVARLSLE